MTVKFTILGCGSSGGIPRPALGWGDCDPNNPKNRRRRTSLLAEQRENGGVTRILVDTSPDLREQLLDAEVDWLDAVLYTHAHADHTHGIDDLRALFIAQRRRLDVYLDEHTARSIHARFGYCFKSPPGSEYPPIATEHRLAPGKPVAVTGKGGTITALPLLQQHGDIPSIGFRFGNLVALPATPESFLAGRRACVDRAAQAAPRHSDQPACRSGLRRAQSQAAAECRAGLRRDRHRGSGSPRNNWHPAIYSIICLMRMSYRIGWVGPGLISLASTPHHTPGTKRQRTRAA
jgi:phosphoribosyl 1,2-cyclic phosphodiesterase